MADILSVDIKPIGKNYCYILNICLWNHKKFWSWEGSAAFHKTVFFCICLVNPVLIDLDATKPKTNALSQCRARESLCLVTDLWRGSVGAVSWESHNLEMPVVS